VVTTGLHVPSLTSRLRTARPVAQLRAGRRDWYSIKNSADGSSAEVIIYDEIGYWGVTAADFVDEVKALDVASLDVRINSPGGEVFDGFAIMNALVNHPASVTTYVDGLAASAASIILQAGARRVAAKASQVMIHEGWGVAIGPATELRALADQLDQVNGLIAEVYADRSGGAVQGWRAAMAAETWYTGAEAAEAGLVDEVTGGGASAAENSWDLSIFAYHGRAKAPAPVIPAAEPEEPTFDAEAFAAAMKEAMNA